MTTVSDRKRFDASCHLLLFIHFCNVSFIIIIFIVFFNRIILMNTHWACSSSPVFPALWFQSVLVSTGFHTVTLSLLSVYRDRTLNNTAAV